MKKISTTRFYLVLRCLLCVVVALAAKEITARNSMQADTAYNDIRLVKPLINTNYPDGGFYSEFYTDQFNYMSCGAIVENIGVNSATHVYLEVKILDYSGIILASYSSDTILSMPANETDTLYIPVISWLMGGNWKWMTFEIKCDSTDSSPLNNADTVPCTVLLFPMWSAVSRATIPTNSLDITQINNFSSGDFIGVTFKVPNNYSHIAVSIEVYMTQAWPDSLELIGKLYRNGTLISVDSLGAPWSFPDWTYSLNIFYMDYIQTDSLYYFGVEINCPPGTNVPIGIDTSSFHNFSSETVARIDGAWVTLDFVPLIRLVCDPEGIDEINTKDQVNVFPNPSSGQINLRSSPQFGAIKKLEIFDCTGKRQMQQFDKFASIDISSLTNGLYFIVLTNFNNERVTGKIIKE